MTDQSEPRTEAGRALWHHLAVSERPSVELVADAIFAIEAEAAEGAAPKSRAEPSWCVFPPGHEGEHSVVRRRQPSDPLERLRQVAAETSNEDGDE